MPTYDPNTTQGKLDRKSFELYPNLSHEIDNFALSEIIDYCPKLYFMLCHVHGLISTVACYLKLHRRKTWARVPSLSNSTIALSRIFLTASFFFKGISWFLWFIAMEPLLEISCALLMPYSGGKTWTLLQFFACCGSCQPLLCELGQYFLPRNALNIGHCHVTIPEHFSVLLQRNYNAIQNSNWDMQNT